MSFNSRRVMWAEDTCGKCGAEIGVAVHPPDGDRDYVDVRCGTCGGFTTADSFGPLPGGESA